MGLIALLALASCRSLRPQLPEDFVRADNPGNDSEPTTIHPPQDVNSAILGQDCRAEVYLGKLYKPVPGAPEFVSGWVIGFSEYLISEWRLEGCHLVFFERVVERNSIGEATFRILDVLALPSLGKGEALLGMTCLFGGEEALEIIAIGEPSLGEPQEIRDLRLTWRANRSTERFEQVDGAGVTCWATAGGP